MLLSVVLGMEPEPVCVRACWANAGWSAKEGISGTEPERCRKAGCSLMGGMLGGMLGAMLLRRSPGVLGTVDGGGVGRRGCATIRAEGDRGGLLLDVGGVLEAGSSKVDAKTS